MSHQNKEWLFKYYHTHRYTIREIAEMVDRNVTTIRYWMKKHGIKPKTKSQGCKDRYLRSPGTNKGKKISITQQKQLREGWQKWRDKNPDFHLGKNGSNWRGGRRITNQGYILIYAPDHPKSGCRKAVPEHRLIAEKALGRMLTDDEIVHHNNGRKADNKPQNLLITTKNFYRWLETKMANLYKEEHFA